MHLLRERTQSHGGLVMQTLHALMHLERRGAVTRVSAAYLESTECAQCVQSSCSISMSSRAVELLNIYVITHLNIDLTVL
jgi:hypothetical protein